MKKVLSLFLVIVMTITVAGCQNNKQSATLDLNKLFTANASIMYDDFEASGKVSRLGNGMWEVEFTSPENLNGVKLSYSDSEITASYLGYNFTLSKEKAPAQNLMMTVFNAIDESNLLPEISYRDEDTMRVFSNQNDNFSYEISVDSATGNLVGFNIPKNNLKIDFTDFMLIQ